MTSDLSHRLSQAAPEQQRELIEELYESVFGTTAMFDSDARAKRFTSMLDCGAYLDAVMLIVPEDCLPMSKTVWEDADKPLHCKLVGYASLDRYTRDENGLIWKENFLSLGATPALALASAIAAAKGV